VRAQEGSDVASFESRSAELKNQLGPVKEIVERGEVAAADEARRRYNDAETQFLLENYEGAAANLKEVVDTAEFRGDPAYPQALYYLAESLFKIESYLESKKYFKLTVETMSPRKARMYQDSLTRLVRLADLTGDYQGVDKYFDAAKQSGGLRSELQYLYAKWIAARTDLTPRDRDIKAATEFAGIQPGQPFYPQALYYRGALIVELGHPDSAIPLFQALTVLKDAKNEAKLPVLRDLAHLALGRIYAEAGKAAAAADEYRAISTNSPEYIDALFERAQVFLRVKDFAGALRTSDTLVLIGRDSPLAPEAGLFQANLLLKMGEDDPSAFDKANASFKTVIQNYQPVRDQIRSIIERPNPVAYFDDLLKRDPTADFTQQLPRAAQGFVETNAQLSSARVIQTQLAGGTKTLDESNVLAKKMLDALSRGGLAAFPQLADANSRTVELSNRLIELERSVVHEQIKLLGDNVPVATKNRLAKMQEDRAMLDALFLQLPKNQDEYEKRLAKFRQTLSGLQLKLFEIRRMMDTVNAMLAGADKYWHDTRDQRHTTPETEIEREGDLEQWHRLVAQLEDERKGLDDRLAAERVHATTEAAGGKEEDDLRDRYHKQFEEMSKIVAELETSVPAQNRPLLKRLSNVRAGIDDEQTTLATLRDQVRQKAHARIEAYRQRVVAEQANLDDHQHALSTLSGNSNQLIGQIAVDAFRKIEKDFYGIVLKGDVGLVDVAWSRKQERTHKIEQYAKEKDEASKILDDRFKEVLGNAD
jgi:hypothetical protein